MILGEEEKAMRKMGRRDFVKLGIASGAGLFAVRAPGAVPPQSTTPKRGGTFTVARSDGNPSFSGLELAMGNFVFIRSLYGFLIRQDNDLNPQPELAESWQFSADRRALTLKLRRGAKFHSGRDFTADDVVFSWKFALEPANVVTMRTLYSLIKDIKTIDKYTVELRFDEPCPLVFDILDTLCMMDRAAVDQLGKADAGGGPFTVTSYTPGAEIRTKRFESYWEKDRPFLDEYVIKQIPDPAALVINLESKAVDAIWGSPVHEVARLKGVPGMIVDPGPAAPNMYHLMVNVRKEPLSNKKVRQAINHAIDRERFCKSVLKETVEPTCLMWPKGSWAYFADLEGKYKYDPSKAKRLLAEAGYPEGFETTLKFGSKIQFGQEGLAQIIQFDLARIGIRAKLIDVESAVYPTQMRKGQFDLAVHNYGRIGRDPGMMLAGAVIWYPKTEDGPIGFDLPDFVRWRDQAAMMLEKDERKDLYRRIQTLVLEECFSMAVAPQQIFWVYRDYVKGLRANREGSPFVGEVWLDK